MRMINLIVLHCSATRSVCEIHNSVPVAFGEVFTFAGALFGVDYSYKYKDKYKYKSKNVP
ncbi:MAG: hypothetical protein LBU37_05005 [Tannerellaceae bacterium]|jgi:hypothetical protein|nr:hypothetical protein [Tannerellaceae bacterium]